MPIINSIMSWIMKKRIHQIELFMKYPNEVQAELLTNLLEKAKNTEFGRKYHFSDIKSYQSYAQSVPLQDYETLKKDVVRIKHGERDLIWPGEIKWFAKSSGTTNDKSKFIPVSVEALEECHFKGGKDMLSIFCNNHPDTLVFDGKTFVLGGSKQVNKFNKASYYGDLSSILVDNLPFWVESRRTPSQEVAQMSDWEQKIERMAKEILHDDVSTVSGVPSWMLVLFNKMLEISGKSNISEIWPNLEIFFHGGVRFEPYKEQFKRLLPSPKVSYLELYNASEGFFGIQDQTDSNELLLMLDYGIFYEFIPLEDIHKTNPKVIPLSEVEVGKVYATVISTNAGLWRYKVGDTVEFTSTYPYRIRVSGRTSHFINAFGEELVLANAETAVSAACEVTNAVVTNYTAGPIFLEGKNAGGHEWLIEFQREPDSIEHFTEVLDNTLQSINSDYEAKRSYNLVLRKPIIRALPENTFYEWLKRKGKLGGQNKVPKLRNDRKFIDEIKELAHINELETKS